MFQGVFSQSSPPARLGILSGLVLAFLLFSTLLGILLLIPFLGQDVLDQISIPDLRDPVMVTALKVMQIVSMAGGLLMPALIYILITEKNPAFLFAFPERKPLTALLLTAVLMIALQPFIMFLNDLNGIMKMPGFMARVEQWMRETEDQAMQLTEAFLGTTSMAGFLLNTFMIAVLPAFTEELLFRGALARLLKEWTKSIHWGVILSAIVFAAIHLQFYGFLPRFLLGAAFGYLYFYTGSLWVPITAHFINNFLTVVVEFLFRRGVIGVDAENFGIPSNFISISISLLLSAGLFSLILKTTKAQKA